MSDRRLRGSCLCGFATYEVADAFEYSLICHCSQCRRATSAGAKPFGGIAAALLVQAEPDRLLRFGDSAIGYDAHCSRCGSLLYSWIGATAKVHVTFGTLIDEPSIRPSAHIFTGSKANWDRIGDGLPQFEGLPDV